MMREKIVSNDNITRRSIKKSRGQSEKKYGKKRGNNVELVSVKVIQEIPPGDMVSVDNRALEPTGFWSRKLRTAGGKGNFRAQPSALLRARKPASQLIVIYNRGPRVHQLKTVKKE